MNMNVNANEAPVEHVQPEAIVEVAKQYFYGANLNNAQAAIDAALEIAEANSLQVVSNINEETGLTDGFGIFVGPLNQRIDNENVLAGILIAQIPSAELLLTGSTEQQQFAVEAVQNVLTAKVSGAARRSLTGDSELPVTIEDYITSNRPLGVLVAFREYANDMVKALKKKSPNLVINPQLLRNALESKAFAEQYYPTVHGDVWPKVIDSMIAKATREGKAAGMLEVWKETRDAAGLPDVKEVSFDDLDF